MAGFQLAYPTHTSPSASWAPSKSPSVRGSSIRSASGYQAEAMSDQRSLVSYRYSAAFSVYTFTFDGLSATDKANLETFRAAIFAGSFEVIDSDAGCGLLTSWTKVKFDPTGLEVIWAPQANRKWGVAIVVRTSI